MFYNSTFSPWYFPRLDEEGDKELAKTNPKINVILGGHSHTSMKHPVKVGGTLIVHSGANAKELSELDLEIEDNKIETSDYESIHVDKDNAELAKKKTLNWRRCKNL